MKMTPPFSAGLSLLLGEANRRLYGLFLLFMTGMTVHALTRVDGFRQGPPPLYATAVLTALLGGLCLFLVLSASLTGKAAASMPGRYTGLQFFAAALTATAALPFLVLSCKIQDLPGQTVLSAGVYLGFLFFGYGLFMETLALILPRSFFFNRTITVILVLAHLLITPRLIPGINPVMILLARQNSPLPSGREFFLALIFPAVLALLYTAVFITVILRKRMKNS